VVIRVQNDSFDVGDELNKFIRLLSSSGAIVSFSGVVRDIPDGLSEMQIEHYPGMTERSLEEICNEACSRWELEDVLVIHRFGNLKKGEVIMMVITASPHRSAAFEAGEFLMDYLKSRAPFWKKEIGLDGSTWVDAIDKDEQALDRWVKEQD